MVQSSPKIHQNKKYSTCHAGRTEEIFFMLKNYFKTAWRNIRKNKLVFRYQYPWFIDRHSNLLYHHAICTG